MSGLETVEFGRPGTNWLFYDRSWGMGDSEVGVADEVLVSLPNNIRHSQRGDHDSIKIKGVDLTTLIPERKFAQRIMALDVFLTMASIPLAKAVIDISINSGSDVGIGAGVFIGFGFAYFLLHTISANKVRSDLHNLEKTMIGQEVQYGVWVKRE